MFSATSFATTLLEELKQDDKGVILANTIPIVTAVAVHVKRGLLFVAYETGEMRAYPYPYVDPQVILLIG